MKRLTDDEFAVLRGLSCPESFDSLNHVVSLNDRVLGRLLQRMKRAGLIEYTRKDGDTRRYWRRTAAGQDAWEGCR